MSEDFWSQIVAFNDKYFLNWRKTPSIYYSNALAGEVGEVCDAIKHMIGGGTRKVDEKSALLEASKECADVLIYLVLLMESLGCRGQGQFNRVFQLKMKENTERMEERGVEKTIFMKLARGS